jgi:monofunctional biosynthetic peptidoglycan transglycosylase
MRQTIARVILGVMAVAFAVFAYIYVTLPDVRPLATTNPTTTAWMAMRAREADANGKKRRHEHRWVPYGRISQHLKRAVLVAEDDGFWNHEGIELEALMESVQENMAKGRRLRGGSTITQQLAKNLYLSPSRDPLRKLRELIIARRLEAALDKARIFEIYLNVIEWGEGVWGAEAAARRYFGVSAASLGREQAALLAGAIINPRLYSPARPPRRLQNRQRLIMARMGTVTPPTPVPVLVAPAETPEVAASTEVATETAEGAVESVLPVDRERPENSAGTAADVTMPQAPVPSAPSQ